MQIFDQEVADVALLKTAVDSFLMGDYRDFQESDRKPKERRSVFLCMVGMLVMTALGLTFLAFMISVFLKDS